MPFRRRQPRRFSVTADSLDALYRAHARGILVFFSRRLSDPQASLDLLAETFTAAFASRRTFKGDSEEQAVSWLYGIAQNVFLMHLRSEGARRRTLARLPVSPPLLTSPEIEQIENLSATGDVRRRLSNAMGALPETHREAIELRVVRELTYGEIAAKLDITEATARARVSRGLRALGGRVGQIDGGPGHEA
ncbi:RNA polymerase sigma factor [Patulibacter sp. NPDC049589]|uniref:RNA polymerase sigma factor n=1 Tax=Patulibacter sp. NPDC049589 TaxID=3154731 RepID=UPI00342012AF